MKRKSTKIIALFMMAVILFSSVGTAKVEAASASDTVKGACAAALNATGNSKKLQFKSSTATDFTAISYRYAKKVSAVFLAGSNNEVYTVCVAKGKTVKDAKALNKAFAAYKKSQINGLYFTKDFSKTEQNIMKNAIYGRKGKYVWYISMSSKKKNQAGQTELKKKL